MKRNTDAYLPCDKEMGGDGRSGTALTTTQTIPGRDGPLEFVRSNLVLTVQRTPRPREGTHFPKVTE